MKELAQKLYDTLFPTAAKIVATGVEHVPMMFVVVDEKVIASPLIGMEKNDMANLHLKLAASPSVSCSCLLLEGWMYRGKKDDKVINALLHSTLSVKDLPEREEAVIFNLRSGGRQWMAICYIDRKNGYLEKAELFDPSGTENPDNKAEGRFVGNGFAEKMN